MKSLLAITLAGFAGIAVGMATADLPAPAGTILPADRNILWSAHAMCGLDSDPFGCLIQLGAESDPADADVLLVGRDQTICATADFERVDGGPF